MLVHISFLCLWNTRNVNWRVLEMIHYLNLCMIAFSSPYSNSLISCVRLMETGKPTSCVDDKTVIRYKTQILNWYRLRNCYNLAVLDNPTPAGNPSPACKPTVAGEPTVAGNPTAADNSIVWGNQSVPGKDVAGKHNGLQVTQLLLVTHLFQITRLV